MREEKKKKIINISLIVGLIVLIAFVIITSIIIHNGNEKYNNLQDENERIEEILSEQESGNE